MRLDDDYQNLYEEDGKPRAYRTGYERRKKQTFHQQRRYDWIALLITAAILFLGGVICGIVGTLATMKGCS